MIEIHVETKVKTLFSYAADWIPRVGEFLMHQKKDRTMERLEVLSVEYCIRTTRMMEQINLDDIRMIVKRVALK